MRRTRDTFGRRSINHIKDCFRADQAFNSWRDIRDELARHWGMNPNQIWQRDVVRWAQKAALELAEDEQFSVTSSVRALAWLRQPNPTGAMRRVSRIANLRNVEQRLITAEILLAADCAQPDATQDEYTRLAQVRMALMIVRQMA